MIDKYEWKCIWLDKDTMFSILKRIWLLQEVKGIVFGKRFYVFLEWGWRFDFSLCVLATELESGRGQPSKA